jgi:ABC-type lipoprotein release transport system permease subunit
VLERRNEIGLRRAPGATHGHIRIQFLSEALLLALGGGAAGLAAAPITGALAGLLPAIKAARLSPTEAPLEHLTPAPSADIRPGQVQAEPWNTASEAEAPEAAAW